MTKPKVCVLRAPGTNCDGETAFAFEQSGGVADRVHVFRLLEQPNLLDEYQVLCVPGGFSYGDDIGAGVIFSRQLRLRLGESIASFLSRDKLALGICNGFQVLLKTGVLPGGADGLSAAHADAPATLTWNENGKYTALWVRLEVASSTNVFLRDIGEIEMPIAHAEGRLSVRDPSAIDAWREHGQVTLCYANGSDATPANRIQSAATSEVLPYPYNPNGSDANIAGLGDLTGRVLGLMPHPERFLFATQHPQWTRCNKRSEGDGMKIFRNAVEYFA